MITVAGHGIGPYTNSTGHDPSGPFKLLNIKVDMRSQSGCGLVQCIMDREVYASKRYVKAFDRIDRSRYVDGCLEYFYDVIVR